MKNLVLIGVGNLGKYHLQSMSDLMDEYDIYAIETNKDARLLLESKFPNVIFKEDMDGVPDNVLAAVIATSSDVRRKVFEDLTYERNISNILFEKILFQVREDYEYVGEVLRKKNINAFVNCIRREYEGYKRLKERITNILSIDISGGEWGIASSGIHMLDLVEYLTDDEIDYLEEGTLCPPIIDSKRKGFKEFFGSIEGKTKQGTDFCIRSIYGSNNSVVINIICDDERIIINEGANEIYFSSEESGWKMSSEVFKTQFQSQMTANILRKIINDGTCKLPSFNESARLHLLYIDLVNKFFKKNGMEEEKCPIT